MKAYFFVLDAEGDFEQYAQVKAIEVEYGEPHRYIADYGAEPTYPSEDWTGGVAILNDTDAPQNRDLFATIHLAEPEEGPLPEGYTWDGDKVVESEGA